MYLIGRCCVHEGTIKWIFHPVSPVGQGLSLGSTGQGKPHPEAVRGFPSSGVLGDKHS
jgi:hypothetical protein